MGAGFTGWHDPKAAEMNCQPQWAPGIHALRTAPDALGIDSYLLRLPSVVSDDVSVSRLSRRDLSHHVFREHIFSNVPVFCNFHAGHV